MLQEMRRAQQPKLSAKEAEAMLKEYSEGVKLRDLCKKYEIGESTFYRWKSMYDGLTAGEIVENRRLKKQNQRLEKKLKQQEDEMKALRSALRKKF